MVGCFDCASPIYFATNIMLRTARLELRAFNDDRKDMEFTMDLSNDLKVQRMTWNGCSPLLRPRLRSARVSTQLLERARGEYAQQVCLGYE